MALVPSLVVAVVASVLLATTLARAVRILVQEAGRRRMSASLKLGKSRLLLATIGRALLVAAIAAAAVADLEATTLLTVLELEMLGAVRSAQDTEDDSRAWN